MILNPQFLQQLSAYQGPDNLHVGNNQGLPISSSGSSIFQINDHHIHLKDIVHVPQINTNGHLLSKLKLTYDNDVFVKFHSFFYLIKDKKTGRVPYKVQLGMTFIILKVSNNHQWYTLESRPHKTRHKRLGHPHFQILVNVIRKFGLPTIYKPKHYLCDSSSCSKSHKLPFTQSTHPSKSPFDLIHSDLWGPSLELSHFGLSYYVIFVDNYSRFKWLYHLKWKSDALSIFLEFQTFLENQFSIKIKAFQSDGGGEFQVLQPLF